MKAKVGPWGGGSAFVKSFSRELESAGFEVCYNLSSGIDVIFLMNPRKGSSEYSMWFLKRYLKKNPNTKLLFSVIECDKRKNTKEIDKKIIKMAKYADHIVFISDWLKDYFLLKDAFPKTIPHSVIYNGADSTIFNRDGFIPWNGEGKIKIVTHHWSNNVMKGFDVYEKIGKLLHGELGNYFELTIIGNLPKKFDTQHVKHVLPLDDIHLAEELHHHHLYITASRWEPCGMHQLEGGMCGLPIMYIKDGGGIVDTCKSVGLEFTEDTVVEKLYEMRNHYDEYVKKIEGFDFSAQKTNEEYIKIINNILSNI